MFKVRVELKMVPNDYASSLAVDFHDEGNPREERVQWRGVKNTILTLSYFRSGFSE